MEGSGRSHGEVGHMVKWYMFNFPGPDLGFCKSMFVNTKEVGGGGGGGGCRGVAVIGPNKICIGTNMHID